MFLNMRHALIPVESESYKGLEGTPTQAALDRVFLTLDDTTTELPLDTNVYEYHGKLELDSQLTFSAYTIGALAFWGSFMLVFFLGTGLVAIPFTHVLAWMDKPLPMNQSQFGKEKDRVAKLIEFMLKNGRELYEKKIKLETEKDEGKMGSFKYWKELRKLQID